LIGPAVLLWATWLLTGLASAATPTPEVQHAVRSATYEVVLHKAASDALKYEKPLPLELVPFVIRNDAYWPIGTAFAIGPQTYVSAAHVFISAFGSQFGAPALRDAAGHVYPVDQILKFSAHEDFVVFTVTGAPAALALDTSTERRIDDVVFAVGNALGEGVIIRDGLLTSETPENQDGRWNWLRFSAAASPGNSGGPLLDATGRVIGVVLAKSPNENLNYALPIARVLEGSANAARIDQRYSVKLPIARESQVATLKSEFPLPKKFGDFSQTYQELTLRTYRRDQQQLMQQLADRLFPKGNSSTLLATVYDSELPSVVQQRDDDAWDAVAPDEVAQQTLPGDGLVSTGKELGVSVFRLRRAAGASDGAFYEKAQSYMDVLLKGLKLSRPVGDQQIRITSLGAAQRESVFEDLFGRRWQVAQWPLGYVDGYVVSYALPVPEGYVGFVQMVPSAQLATFHEYLHALADHVYVNYAGTLPQWNAFLSRRTLRPKLFDTVKLEVDPTTGIHFESPRLALQMPNDLVGTSEHSELALHMTYLLAGEALRWEVGALVLYQDRDRHTFVGVERHAKPAQDADRDLLDTWTHLSTQQAGFNGLAGHDDQYRNFWIHEVVGAQLPDRPGIDPADTVLYEVYCNTQSDAYPRDLEDMERRLVRATHVLER
jgi:hypothetical protein